MSAEVVSIVFTAFATLGGFAGLAAFANVLMQRNKINAEAKKLGVDADALMSDKALDMYREARKEATEAKAEARETHFEVEYCRAKIQAIEDHVEVLECRLRDAGISDIPTFSFPLYSTFRSEKRDA